MEQFANAGTASRAEITGSRRPGHGRRRSRRYSASCGLAAFSAPVLVPEFTFDGMRESNIRT
jgi:hypothetical protein